MPSGGPWCSVRYNVDDPDDLKVVTISGLIWRTPYAQRAVDAIRSGLVSLADCKDMPAIIRAALILEESE